MKINPVVETRSYIDGVEVITPRGIESRIEGVHGNTARRWLNLPEAPKPVAHSETRGDLYWNADEALAFIIEKIVKQVELEAKGYRRVGRPRRTH